MRASIPQHMLLVASVSAVGCIAPLSAPTLTPLAEAVRVYPSEGDIPPNCESLGRLSVVDGNIESSKGYMYQGTRDRALVRIRNEAAAHGGNAVVIEDEGPVLMVDGPEVGQYYINGRALKCASAVRPNTRVNPTHAVVTALAHSSKRRATRPARYRGL